jgi:hypothetical protein
MLLINDEKKKIIYELQAIPDKRVPTDKSATFDEYMIIDFMRNYFSHDVFSDLFEDEREEKIKNKQNNSDIRTYTFRALYKYIPAKYNIDSNYVNIKELKVIIFYEHIMKCLDNSIKENEEKNKKIKEYKEVYNLFKALLSRPR